MIVHEVIQGTPEWFKLRKGKLTASHATAIANQGKGLDTYVKEVIIGMFIDEEHYMNYDMERGNLLEPIARVKYSFEFGFEVDEVGFIEYTERSGYSPDGLVGKDGLLEIKCRNNKIHLDLILTNKIDTSTVWQMQMGMLCSGRKWCDFISYNPNFKQNSLYVKRVMRDEIAIEKLKEGIKLGTEKINELLKNDKIKKEF